MKRRLILILLNICALTVYAGGEVLPCPLVHVDIERLPDLNIARAGHMVCCLDGELTVIGGHTDGFVLTPTAEYLSDGEWHVVPTVYTHDDGVGVVLPSNNVLMAGGHEKNLGIGQSYEVEKYYYQKHSFSGFGCLNTKRSLANGVVSNGQVVIAGNWNADDDIEAFDGKKSFKHVRPVSFHRTMPFLYNTSDNDVMVIGGLTTRGEWTGTKLVDHKKGEPLEIELFETWQPTGYAMHQSEHSFIGPDDQGRYQYLMPVKNSEGQMAIALVKDTTISLFPTVCTIPMESKWGKINYFSPVVVDREKEMGYIAGYGKGNRFYALGINYAKKPAALTLYYTDEQKDSCLHIPVLTPAGNLVFMGGSFADNFKPFKAVYLMNVGGEECFAAAKISPLSWVMLVLAVVGAAGVVFYRKRQHGKQTEDEQAELTEGSQELMERIDAIVVEQKRYLDSKLKVSDIANELGVHRNKISECINSQKGCTFTQYVNGLRIENAKRMMTENPDIKMQTVTLESGYGNEASFYRIFKAFTGMTPREWIEKNT